MGTRYYFCSAGCRAAFEKDPARYAARPVFAGHAADTRHPSVARIPLATSGGEVEKRSAIDPVCGMSVDIDRAEYRSFQKGETYYFCSAGCKQTFDRDPAQFVDAAKK